jgi:hypothetical protein
MATSPVPTERSLVSRNRAADLRRRVVLLYHCVHVVPSFLPTMPLSMLEGYPVSFVPLCLPLAHRWRLGLLIRSADEVRVARDPRGNPLRSMVQCCDRPFEDSLSIWTEQR